jgi:hypothetical protein
VLRRDAGSGDGARHDAEDRDGVAAHDEDLRPAAHPAFQDVEGRSTLERFHLEAIGGTQEADDAFGIARR